LDKGEVVRDNKLVAVLFARMGFDLKNTKEFFRLVRRAQLWFVIDAAWLRQEI
jgi:hypothetical protein